MREYRRGDGGRAECERELNSSLSGRIGWFGMQLRVAKHRDRTNPHQYGGYPGSQPYASHTDPSRPPKAHLTHNFGCAISLRLFFWPLKMSMAGSTVFVRIGAFVRTPGCVPAVANDLQAPPHISIPLTPQQCVPMPSTHSSQCHPPLFQCLACNSTTTCPYLRTRNQLLYDQLSQLVSTSAFVRLRA